MDEMLAEYGLDTTTAACLVVAVAAIVWFAKESAGPAEPPPTVELHPEHLKYMRAKEAMHCRSSNEGKGIRCIIDYLREEKDSDVRAILDEKPAFKDGFELFEFDVHDQQFDYLAETCGIKIGNEDGPERYKDFGKAVRAMLDWAMRMEKEGTDKDYDLFETVRCLNC